VIFKSSVPIFKKTNRISITKTSQLMAHVKLDVVHSENQI